MELTNPLTGQTYKNAIAQYQNDRNPRELLLAFKKRAIVHFAVDTEEVWMTTWLRKLDTVFLPFNKGYNKGAGNPLFRVTIVRHIFGKKFFKGIVS
jgi:type I restriction enzyme R subunit